MEIKMILLYDKAPYLPSGSRVLHTSATVGVRAMHCWVMKITIRFVRLTTNSNLKSKFKSTIDNYPNNYKINFASMLIIAAAAPSMVHSFGLMVVKRGQTTIEISRQS